MSSYQKGIEIAIDKKDISAEDFRELEQVISRFLIEKNYINPKLHRVGVYNKNLEPIWKKCEEIINKK